MLAWHQGVTAGQFGAWQSPCRGYNSAFVDVYSDEWLRWATFVDRAKQLAVTASKVADDCGAR